jgi:hypothetical protein
MTLIMKIARIMRGGGCETEIFLSLSHSSHTNLAMFMAKVMLDRDGGASIGDARSVKSRSVKSKHTQATLGKR